MAGKRTLVIVVLVAVAGGGLWALTARRQTRPPGEQLLGDTLELQVYTSGGRAVAAALYVPFVGSVRGATVDVALDTDGDGAFDLGRDDIPIVPRADWKHGFALDLAGKKLQRPRGRVALDTGESLEAVVTLRQEDVGSLLDLATVTNPEESMKGWGRAALAKEPATEASRGNVPDLTQRIAECAPTAAANSIMSLAEEHGRSLADLPTPTEIVDELKGDMDWTPADGVLPDNFVRGKNEWAAKNGLPIRTEKVGDKDGAKTIQELLDAMASSAAAELRVRFADANGKVVGGHMVTVTGVRTSGGQTFIDVNDPKTPAGTETYEVNGNVIEGYPFDGLAVASWGFVQRWEGSPTGTSLEPLTDEEVRGIKEFVGEQEKIKVIVVNGKKVPLEQVHVGKGPECDSEQNQLPHYHANAGSVTALDGTVTPDPGGCGYGKVRDVPVEEVALP
jgi:hypothetical protein